MALGDDAVPVGDAVVRVAGPWHVGIHALGGVPEQVFPISRPRRIRVSGELHEGLPEWIPDQPGWARSSKFRELDRDGHHGRLAVDLDSVRLRDVGERVVFARGRDFECEDEWGSLGRVATGLISAGGPVLVDYAYRERRIDSLVERRDGIVELRRGRGALATPEPAALSAGERRIANVWIPPQIRRLTSGNILPVLESSFPERPRRSSVSAATGCPRFLAKLRSGQPVRVLAWGDSVTQGYPGAVRWQDLFVAMLSSRFPKARIELGTRAWGAHNMGHFLDAPSGHPGNFREQVLGWRPDLVVSEFVNDTVLAPERVRARMSAVWSDFRALGIEWIVTTPHYMLPEWMGLGNERDCDDDPRPVVSVLRRFTSLHGLPLADASWYWGRLWRQGIPYTSWMLNGVNHPGTRGMELYGRALEELFSDESGVGV